MADVSKIQLPNGTVLNIKDGRITGIDSTPTSSSGNVVTSGGVYTAIAPAFVNASSAQDGSVVLTKKNGDTVTIDLNHTHPDKQDALVSGTNIKTINNTSLLGSGNIQIQADTPVASSIPSGGMLPNVVYNLGTLSGNTTMTMASATDNTIVNLWHFTFTTPSTAPTITWDNAITAWYGGGAPTITGSTYYEVSVMNGVAIIMDA